MLAKIYPVGSENAVRALQCPIRRAFEVRSARRLARPGAVTIRTPLAFADSLQKGIGVREKEFEEAWHAYAARSARGR